MTLVEALKAIDAQRKKMVDKAIDKVVVEETLPKSLIKEIAPTRFKKSYRSKDKSVVEDKKES